MPNEATSILPLTEEQMQKWWSDIDAAERVRKQHETWWQENIRLYSPEVTRDPTKYGADINTNRDFQLVEQKKAQLFFQSPEISIKPSPLMMGQEEALLAHQDILNELLGPDGVNAKGMVREALFDTLCPAGFGVTKMGYENVTEMVETQIPIPDPVTGAPAVDPMTGQPLTVPQRVPVPIWERLFWERVTPKKVLIPSGFSSTNYDEAPWLGVRFSLTLNEARLRYQLPEDFEAKAGKDEFKFDHGTKGEEEGKPVEGVEIWYRAAIYDDTVRNPDLLRCLVLIKGLEQPVKHMDSPYQELDPQTGRLSPRSLKGYPVHILTIRTLADSAYVMSDCSISRPQVNELNRFREQQIKLRDSNIPIRVAHPGLPPETMQKFANADYGSGPIQVPDEVWGGTGDNVIKEISKATYPRENMAFEEKQDNDISRTHAMDANQGGTRTDDARTATELQLIQVNTNVRLDAERAAVLEWYVKGVTKFSTLVQRFVTVEQAAQIVGPEKAQLWKQTMEMVPAPLAFSALPDSAIRVDAAQNRKMTLEKYQYLRNDPLIDAAMFLKKDVLPVMGVSQAAIKPPQPPPPPQPDPPKVSVSIASASLNPMMPEYPGVVLVLKASGLDVSQLPPPMPVVMENPGLVQPEKGMSGASKPEGTGGLQGTNYRAPIAPGGSPMEQ